MSAEQRWTVSCGSRTTAYYTDEMAMSAAGELSRQHEVAVKVTGPRTSVVLWHTEDGARQSIRAGLTWEMDGPEIRARITAPMTPAEARDVANTLLAAAEDAEQIAAALAEQMAGGEQL